MTAAQRRTNAAWLRGEVDKLRWRIAGAIRNGKGHRWTLDRVVQALKAIEDGYTLDDAGEEQASP